MHRWFALIATLTSWGCGAAFDVSEDGAGGAGSGGEPPVTSTTGGVGGGTNAVGGGGAPTSWPMTGHTFRKRVAIAQLGLDADVDDVVVPLVVNDPDIAAAAQADGRDIMFTTEDALTPVVYELEHYDAGSLVAWARVPKLAAAGDTVLYVYYGSSDTAVREDPAATWNGIATSVWHMDGATAVTDSAAGHHGTPPGAAETPTLVDGIAGTALSFDLDDTIKVTDPPDGSLDFGMNSFSFSLWLMKGAVEGSNDIIFRKYGTCGACTGWGIVCSPSDWHASFEDGGAFGPNVAFGAAADFMNQWTHLGVVVDREGGEIRTYANGARGTGTASLSGASGFSNNRVLDMGLPTGWPLDGVLDEVRVYPEAVPPSWFFVEHALLTKPDLVSLSEPESAP